MLGWRALIDSTPVRQLFWKRGAFNRGKSAKQLRDTRSFSDDGDDRRSGSSCPPAPEKPACPIPDPTVCEPPTATAKGRVNKQPEVAPCVPDCRAGKPHLPERGCLPWEKAVEMCPTKKPFRKLESLTCDHLCETYPGEGIIDRLKVTVCEFRRFQKCFEKMKDPKLCLGLGPKLGTSLKEYPMMHAVQKQGLAGCPTTLPQVFTPKTLEPEC